MTLFDNVSACVTTKRDKVHYLAAIAEAATHFSSMLTVTSCQPSIYMQTEAITASHLIRKLLLKRSMLSSAGQVPLSCTNHGAVLQGVS